MVDVSPCFFRVSFRKDKVVVQFGETLGLDDGDDNGKRDSVDEVQTQKPEERMAQVQ